MSVTESNGPASKVKATGQAPPKLFLKAFTRAHLFLRTLTGGRLFNSLGGDPICVVHMTGAKSGRRRVIPLMYVPHGEAILLVASQGGAPSHPAWYHNLIAHPDIDVDVKGEHRKLRARLARSEERSALWEVCDAAYAPFATYRQRTSREIPIFVCEPR